MPIFTMREIELHRQKSGKRNPGPNSKSLPIKKTLNRGTKFKQERYLSADYIFAKLKGDQFQVKGKCRASMNKREVHNVEVFLNQAMGIVQTAHCTLDLFKPPSEKKIRVNDNMSIRVQRSPRLGKGTNGDLFPLAGLLNINELGHMLHPRLRNNRTITLSRGNTTFVFCLVNMSYSPAGPKGIY